jgi:hypothetical protein
MGRTIVRRPGAARHGGPACRPRGERCVSGPFAIYPQPFGNGYTLSQVQIVHLMSQGACKHAAEEFAAVDMNWWTCIPEEVIGPDLQAMRNLHIRLRASWVTVGTGRP